MVLWLISVTLALFQIGINALKLGPEIKIACLQLAVSQDWVQHHLKQASVKMRAPQNDTETWKEADKQLKVASGCIPAKPLSLQSRGGSIHQLCLVPSDSQKHLKLF